MSEETATLPTETQPPTPAPDATADTPTTEKSLLNSGDTPPLEPFTIEKLEVPEGFTLADETKATIAEMAAKHNLPQAAMADLAGLYFSEVKAMQERLTAQIDQTWTETQAKWTSEVFEKFGGKEGAMKAAGRFAPIINQMGGPALTEALDVTGFGNHPAAFALFATLAEKFGEATPVGSQAVPKATVNPLDAMYPSLVKKG